MHRRFTNNTFFAYLLPARFKLRFYQADAPALLREKLAYGGQYQCKGYKRYVHRKEAYILRHLFPG